MSGFIQRKGLMLRIDWMRVPERWLPFADAASPELPLSRLLRLSLFQVSVGMCAVLLIGTLNRVMIVELGVAASLVAVALVSRRRRTWNAASRCFQRPAATTP